MAYNPTGKFKQPFNPQHTNQQAIEKTNLNMGALHYVHTNGLLMAMSEARVNDDPAHFTRLLKSLFAISKIKIGDIVDIKKIKVKLNNLQPNLTNYDYLKYCLYNGTGNQGALQPLEQASFYLWSICENLFDEVYSSLDKKGMILPEKSGDNIGKYLQEFGVNFGGPQQ